MSEATFRNNFYKLTSNFPCSGQQIISNFQSWKQTVLFLRTLWHAHSHLFPFLILEQSKLLLGCLFAFIKWKPLLRPFVIIEMKEILYIVFFFISFFLFFFSFLVCACKGKHFKLQQYNLTPFKIWQCLNNNMMKELFQVPGWV